jgi:hypothetical protein
MSRISASSISVSAFLPLLLIASALPAHSSDATSPTVNVSKVRIVRLSEVKGEVMVDLNNGHGFEKAMANLPIVEQMRLQTGAGVAEVEFEDNSTLRLAPDSMVEFPRLELLPSGAKASTVHVLKGMVYVSLVHTPGNDFALLFGQQKLQLPPSSHVRLEMEPSEAKLAVLEGAVQIDGPSGTVDVPKKKTVTFQLADAGQPTVAKNVESNQFDSWDHDAADYHKRFATLSALNSSPYSYGVSDLAYYGAFSDAGGCGSMWHPYFASASWEPFSNGAWAWYQGAGYSWVSPYPWAWTPYHSGSWAFCPGAGWGWQPGSSWNGLSNAPSTLIGSSGKAGPLPRPPSQGPRLGESTLMPVNLRPLASSAIGAEDSFVFRKDSAGLGVPRGTLGNLNKVSERAVVHGSATVPVYSPAPASDEVRGRSTIAVSAPTSLRRGYAPPSAPTASPTYSGPSMSSPSSTMSSQAPTVHAGSGLSPSHPH